MTTQNTLRAAILVISETASRDPSTDKCIDTLHSVFDEDGGDQWEIAATQIVSDSVLDIQRAVTQWTDSEDDKMNLILTSGGTGFAVKDVTPEVSLLNVLVAVACEIPCFSGRKSRELRRNSS